MDLVINWLAMLGLISLTWFLREKKLRFSMDFDFSDTIVFKHAFGSVGKS